MNDYFEDELPKRISSLIREGKTGEAIGEVIRAIGEGEKLKRTEDVIYLYSQLAGLYLIQGRQSDIVGAMEECEAKFPDSVLARYMYVEKLFWSLRDYEGTVRKVESLIEIMQMNLNYYGKALYLKGLAHAELGQYQEAVEMLMQTNYYDLTLVEKLVENGYGLAECQQFLSRALERNRTWQEAGSDVTDSIERIDDLMSAIKQKCGKEMLSEE